MGIAVSFFAFFLAIAYLVLKLSGYKFPVGNPTIVIVVAFFSGIQMLSLGVMGEYVGRIYDEVRERPKYIIESRYGL
jgi:dolichol-phosphate mannosyltransferase